MFIRAAHLLRFALCCCGASASLGCGSSDPTGSGGEGTLTFTTWGEDYIEQEIPAAADGEDGFVDGWSVKYTKFLVNIGRIEVADARGEVAASMDGTVLFDNHLAGVKRVAKFEGVEAKAWDRVGYAIAPVDAETELAHGVDEDDRDLMQDHGYSLYVEGTATQGERTKSFAWGFEIGTRYRECHSQQDGRDTAGVVVKDNGELDVQLTTHGDHLFYDRLQSSPDPAVETALRFDALAAADSNGDDEVTIEELNAAPLDVRHYDPSGFPAATHGAFVTALARTVGHFRGEGECNVGAL